MLRDDVTAFQKWGSRLFTWGHVSEEYGAAWYFTDSRAAPVREAFIAQLDVALATHAEVDLFFLAHHNDYLSWVAALPPERLRRVRLVYNTGCHNLSQGQYWLELGADAFIGHEGLALSPIFYFYFLRRWAHGERLDGAVAEANALAGQVLHRAGLAELAPTTRAWIVGDDALAIDGSAR